MNDKEVDCVPVFTSLSEAYIDTENSIRDKHEPRYISLTKQFVATYGQKP